MNKEKKHFAAGKTNPISEIITTTNMKRNPVKDKELFHCNQHDIEHVIAHYPDHENRVRIIINQACSSGALQYYTHQDVHYYVQRHLGLEDN